MANKRRTIYWLSTIAVALGLVGSGVQQLLRTEGEGALAPPYAWGIVQLGYPVYILTLLGVWKLLGAAAILLPRYPLLKEWAYAGLFFLFTGGVFSHVASGDAWYELLPALILLALSIVSWHFRPADRRLLPRAAELGPSAASRRA
ncbi:DoxX family protein [Nonomuraea bangladeshensis]|uniref:DoxX family protein n=1 Tax=Nonomuraea bangladeshensis TaxID=404385 RepID=UPI0031D60AC0